jgi:hypothetical protein
MMVNANNCAGLCDGNKLPPECGEHAAEFSKVG